MKVFGFSFIRNGLKYDYPFMPSYKGLSELCDRLYLAVGESDDKTLEKVQELNPQIINTVWDDNLRNGGLILSQQTNIALEEIRKNEPTQGNWAVYLQGDEVLKESDFEQIRKDLVRAQEQGFDAVRFRYLHFWLDYRHIAIAKRWYPQEIRAVRLNSNARSYGDAQSFENVGRVYESDVFVHHYGHVRKHEAYEEKKRDFHRWWHSDEEMKKIQQERQPDEETLLYLGPHPRSMENRMGLPEFPESEKVYVLGNKDEYSFKFHQAIKAKKIVWALDRQEFKVSNPKPLVDLRSGFWSKVKSSVPTSMKSKKARPWDKEFIGMLKFSQAFVSMEDYQ